MAGLRCRFKPIYVLLVCLVCLTGGLWLAGAGWQAGWVRYLDSTVESCINSVVWGRVYMYIPGLLLAACLGVIWWVWVWWCLFPTANFP